MVLRCRVQAEEGATEPGPRDAGSCSREEDCVSFGPNGLVELDQREPTRERWKGVLEPLWRLGRYFAPVSRDVESRC